MRPGFGRPGARAVSPSADGYGDRSPVGSEWRGSKPAGAGLDATSASRVSRLARPALGRPGARAASALNLRYGAATYLLPFAL